ncbi:prostate stem cell antigen-like [Pelobates fuscus]|uniref:prostate stem cell antigen-like n=1 Tax=Pelobates fuscus TaxID=191477 RepID=UPI002FE43024
MFFLHPPGQAYQCYTCNMATNDAECMQVTNCSSPTPYCGSVVVDASFIKVVSKFCSAACVNGNQNVTILSSTERCCQSDLCNDQSIGNNNFDFGSGASGMTSNIFLIFAFLLSVITVLSI